MNRAQQNLIFARWLFPGRDWKATTTGKVIGMLKDLDSSEDLFAEFDINNPRDGEKIVIKLKQAHNITIHERSRDGTPCWEAISQDAPNMRGSHKHSDLVELLVQVVEGLKDG